MSEDSLSLDRGRLGLITFYSQHYSVEPLIMHLPQKCVGQSVWIFSWQPLVLFFVKLNNVADVRFRQFISICQKINFSSITVRQFVCSWYSSTFSSVKVRQFMSFWYLSYLFVSQSPVTSRVFNPQDFVLIIAHPFIGIWHSTKWHFVIHKRFEPEGGQRRLERGMQFLVKEHTLLALWG